MQIRSTLYNYQSTHLHFSLSFSPLLSLSLSYSLLLEVGWCLSWSYRRFLLQWKSKCSHTLSEVSHFYDLENPSKFVAQSRILRNTATELLKTLKIRIVPREPGRIKPSVKRHVLVVKLTSDTSLRSGDYLCIGVALFWGVFTYILFLQHHFK